MSTFGGKLLEETLDFIRIDQFELQNHDGSKFFLSHFHSDHYRGMFENPFIKQLNENDDKMIYCSEFTKKLILSKSQSRIPPNKIFSLDPHSPYMVVGEGRDPVVVRTIPAGHCPGSVMFLIEQGSIRVLYTGDFRVHPDELRKFNALYEKSGSLKKINTLYLDATFCSTKWLTFPSREESLEEMTNIIECWLEEDPEHEVGIWYISYHGLEWVLMCLARTLLLQRGIWVVDEESYNNYACISELQGALSRKKGCTRIHLCSVREGATCRICSNNRSNIKTIKPCAFGFNQKKLAEGISQQEGDVLKVAYATHSSLEELVATVIFLSPERIHICALAECTSETQALENLKLDVDKLKAALENQENDEGNSPKKPRLQTLEEVCKICHAVQDNEISLSSRESRESSAEDDSEAEPLPEGELLGLDLPVITLPADTPITLSADTPITISASTPIVMVILGLSGSEEELLSDPPVTTRSDPPVTTPSDPPVTTPSDPPVTTLSDPPVTTRSDPPVTTRSDPPVTTPSDPPVTTRSDPPVTTRSDPPVTTRSDPPVTTRSDPPVTTRSDPPVITLSGSEEDPLSQEDLLGNQIPPGKTLRADLLEIITLSSSEDEA